MGKKTIEKEVRNVRNEILRDLNKHQRRKLVIKYFSKKRNIDVERLIHTTSSSIKGIGDEFKEFEICTVIFIIDASLRLKNAYYDAKKYLEKNKIEDILQKQDIKKEKTDKILQEIKQNINQQQEKDPLYRLYSLYTEYKKFSEETIEIQLEELIKIYPQGLEILRDIEELFEENKEKIENYDDIEDVNIMLDRRFKIFLKKHYIDIEAIYRDQENNNFLTENKYDIV